MDVEVYRPTNVYAKITGAEMPPRTIDRAAFSGRFPRELAVEPVGIHDQSALTRLQRDESDARTSWLRDFDGPRSRNDCALLAEATVDANSPTDAGGRCRSQGGVSVGRARRSALGVGFASNDGHDSGVVAVAVEAARKRTKP